MKITEDNKKQLTKKLKDESGLGIGYCIDAINSSLTYEEAKCFYTKYICPDCGNRLSNLFTNITDCTELRCLHCNVYYTFYWRSEHLVKKHLRVIMGRKKSNPGNDKP